MKKLILFLTITLCFLIVTPHTPQAQNVGIGTTTPTEKLEVGGNLLLNSGAPALKLKRGTGILASNTIDFLTGADVIKFRMFETGTIFKMGRPLGFSTEDDLVIKTDNGNVGIGIAMPTRKLEVNGNIRSTGRIDADGVMEASGLSSTGVLYVGQTSILQGAITGNSSATISGLIKTNTGVTINDPVGTLQFQNSNVDKGFVQLSGDDLRIGTNSSNTNGKFVVRTSGFDQMEIDGTTGINVLRLNALGSHKASLTTLPNNNLMINTVNSNSLLMLNNEVYINATNSRTGMGTVTPEEKLHVFGGNIKVTNGKLLNSPTGAFDMMPLCYGRINANGTVYAATPNVSINRTSAGTYEIICGGITDGSVILVTVYGSTRYIGTGSYVSAGKMLVAIENIKEVIDDPDAFHSNDDKTFYFVIYN